MGVEAATYRYECCEEMIDGMKDYLKGPDHVFMLCKQGMRSGRKIQLEDIDPLMDGLRIIDSAPPAGFNHRRFTLNGMTRGAVGDIEEYLRIWRHPISTGWGRCCIMCGIRDS